MYSSSISNFLISWLYSDPNNAIINGDFPEDCLFWISCIDSMDGKEGTYSPLDESHISRFEVLLLSNLALYRASARTLFSGCLQNEGQRPKTKKNEDPNFFARIRHGQLKNQAKAFLSANRCENNGDLRFVEKTP